MFTKSLKRKPSATNIVTVCFQPFEPQGSSSSVNYERHLSFRSHSDSKYSGSTLNRVNPTNTKSSSRWAGLMSFFPFLTSFLPPSHASTVHSTPGGIQSSPVPTRRHHNSARIFKSRRQSIPSIVITDANDDTNEYVPGDEKPGYVTSAVSPSPPAPAPWTVPKGSVLLSVPPVVSLRVLPRAVNRAG
ncbi:hypothetical protein BS47DRAFT_1353040 [Hydnum rufescens UP504]|uniref:Uncharacterized protein n=1 Tax=Hydnum rufescens UP504 TaxID=1448309 RepID=A0A9P6AHY1_9AGAM|nr:hypothetical protein BS47DRAFT_1353040 [Hydnum rufescens UP504]